jgi:hypothetical protein
LGHQLLSLHASETRDIVQIEVELLGGKLCSAALLLEIGRRPSLVQALSPRLERFLLLRVQLSRPAFVLSYKVFLGFSWSKSSLRRLVLE